MLRLTLEAKGSHQLWTEPENEMVCVCVNLQHLNLGLFKNMNKLRTFLENGEVDTEDVPKYYWGGEECYNMIFFLIGKPLN